MRHILSLSLFAAVAGNASAATTLNAGATFNTAASSWSNGVPSSTNPGTINADYTIGGNVGVGAYTVTQIAGNGTGGQFNYNGNANFVFTLQGGTITSTGSGQSFFANAGTTNISGGTLSAVRLQSANGGRFNISGGLVSSTSGILLDSNGAGSSFYSLTGGTTSSNAATTFLAASALSTTIGGSAIVNAATITGLGTTATNLNFNTNWTGSLNFASGTDWAAALQTSGARLGGVDIDSTNINQFQITGGTISLVPEPSAALLGAFGLLGLLRRRRA